MNKKDGQEMYIRVSQMFCGDTLFCMTTKLQMTEANGWLLLLTQREWRNFT